MLMADGPIDLLSKARAGETEALGELCALYRNYLRMVVRTGLGPRLRERVEMSDVVQEVLVEVVRQFPQFTGQNEAALVGWLRRLVGQKLADLGRYHSRAKRAGASTALPLEGVATDAAAGSGRAKRAAGCWTCWHFRRPVPARRSAGASRSSCSPTPWRPFPWPRPIFSGFTRPRASRSRRSANASASSRKSIRGIWARGLKRLKRSTGRASRRPIEV